MRRVGEIYSVMHVLKRYEGRKKTELKSMQWDYPPPQKAQPVRAEMNSKDVI
jgi:hypothetical protein